MAIKKKKEKPNLGLRQIDDLDALIAELNSRYGAGSAILASQIVTTAKYTPTGISALDFALRGGFRDNRIYEVRGMPSSFKSTLSQMGIASFQRRHAEGVSVFVDLERTYDPFYAAKLGVDNDLVIVITPDSGEQAINLLNDSLTVARPTFAVLDSIAALVPSDEITSPVEQQFMGLQARLVNRMLRIIVARMKRSLHDLDAPPVTLLMLNQLRNKVGVVYGNPETAPGGMGKEFAASVIMRLNATPSDEIRIDREVNGVKRSIRVGQRVTFRISKNKAGGPRGEEGEFVFYEMPHQGYSAFSVDNERALFEYGCFYEVIDVDDQYFSFGELKRLKQDAFCVALRRNPKAFSLLRRAILNALKEEDSAEEQS